MNTVGTLKKLGVLFLAMSLCLAFARPASAQSAVFYASTLPYQQAMYVCIGGEMCGMNDTITVDLPYQFIRFIKVYAHDRKGQVHQAALEVYIDENYVGRQDVKRDGSLLTFYANRPGRSVVLKSVRPYSSAGDETVVEHIEILP